MQRYSLYASHRYLARCGAPKRGASAPISRVSGLMNRQRSAAAWLVVHQDLRRSARIRVVTSAIVDAFRRQSGTLRHGLSG
jgi:hypothetical protein